MKYSLHIKDAFLVDFEHNYKTNSSNCYELYSKKSFNFCCDANFVQDELFISQKNVIDGMTLLPPSMGLFARCLSGYCLFVFIDLRKESPTFMAKMEVPLNTPATGVFVPPGCAFGFCVLEGPSFMYYKTTAEFEDKIADEGFTYNDPDAKLCWPEMKDKIVSTKPKSLKTLLDQI